MIDPDLETPGAVDDFGHAGHGFWLQSPTVRVEDNVAAGHRCNAYTFWTRAIVDEPVADFPDSVRARRTVPLDNLRGQGRLRVLYGAEYGADALVESSRVKLRPFRNNVAFASGGGVSFERNHRISEHYRYDDWSVIEGFTAYAIGDFEPTETGPIAFLPEQGGSAIVHRFGRNLIVRDSRLVGSDDGRIGHRVAGNQGYGTMVSVENTTYEGWSVGVDAAHRDRGQYVGCRFDNEIDVRIVGGDVAEGNSTSAQDVEIRDCTFVGDEPHVELLLEPHDHEDGYVDQPGHGLANNLYDLFAGLSRTLDGRELYFDEQAPDHVPIPDADRLSELSFKHHDSLAELAEDYQHDLELDEIVPADLVGMTNRELMDAYGIAVEGAVAPADAVDDPRIRGGRIAAEPYATARVDASEADATGRLSVVDDPTAAGDASLAAPDRDRRRDPPASPDATYEISVPADGEYALWARLFAPTTLPGGRWATTGFWIRVDGSDWIDATAKRESDTWEWLPVQSAWPDDYSDPLAHETYALAAGTHTIDVAFAGRHARLDELYLTNNLRTVPVGPGDAGGPADSSPPSSSPSPSPSPAPFADGVPGVDGAPPTDPDGDGAYEDVDGDGDSTLHDVVDLLFADHDAVNADPERAALDFDDSGRVGFGDVVRLLFEV
jgi:hypothetical protein